jgi:hypothetical protein
MRQARSDAGTTKVEDPKLSYGEGLRVGPADFIEHYRWARTAEARAKAELFGLKNGILVGTHLDRVAFVREASFVLSTVKDRILGSNSLSAKAKDALLNRLASCVEFKVTKNPRQPVDPAIPQERPENWTSYQFERLREVHSRATNFRLKAEALKK